MSDALLLAAEGYNVVPQTSKMKLKNSLPPRHFQMRTRKGSKI